MTMDSSDSASLEFRDHLIKAQQTASRDFDKAIMTLSAGALGISLAFVHNVSLHPKWIVGLAASWGFFALSLAFVVVSLLTSQAELDRYLARLDAGDRSHGFSWTELLNWLAGFAFLLGVVLLIIFAYENLKRVHG